MSTEINGLSIPATYVYGHQEFIHIHTQDLLKGESLCTHWDDR